jgi:hypothetical protein
MAQSPKTQRTARSSFLISFSYLKGFEISVLAGPKDSFTVACEIDERISNATELPLNPE